jgi:hypothetical protein
MVQMENMAIFFPCGVRTPPWIKTRPPHTGPARETGPKPGSVGVQVLLYECVCVCVCVPLPKSQLLQSNITQPGCFSHWVVVWVVYNNSLRLASLLGPNRRRLKHTPTLPLQIPSRLFCIQTTTPNLNLHVLLRLSVLCRYPSYPTNPSSFCSSHLGRAPALTTARLTYHRNH